MEATPIIEVNDNENIGELLDTAEEIVGVVEQNVVIAGVRTINGKSGDLDLKTINNIDLLTPGNLDLQPTLTAGEGITLENDTISADTTVLATKEELAGKQDQLTETQLDAVNSGITSTLVTQITTNKNNITTINSKIPAQATSTNKLADKDFVNSSIATETANYISNNGEPFTSVAQLEAYTGTVTDNDYAFVTGTDSAGNTYYDRYKATVQGGVVTWAKEYRLNNSSFTSDQWTAINSGATTGLIEQITTNQNDIATLQTDKQDKLVAGTNIQIASDGKTISATDTKYTAGTGLTLTGTQFSVTEPVPAGFFTDTASTQEGEGTRITLNNTTDAPIDGVELKGNTYQTTYTGKNILPITVNSPSGLTVTYDAATGEISVSGTASTNWNTISSITNLANSIPEGTTVTLVRSLTVISGTTPETTAVNLRDSSADNSDDFNTGSATSDTASHTVSKEITRAGITQRLANGQTYNFKIKVQLELGSQPTNIEPYVGGLPSPSPSYPQIIDTVTGSQTVSVVGKNLWNPTAYQENHFIAADGTESTNTTTNTWGNIYVPAGTNMTISAIPGDTSSTAIRVHAFTLAGVWKEQVTVLTLTGGNYGSATFTTPNEPVLLRWCGSKKLSSCQLELGLTATAYQPYESQSYTIDLGIIELCKIGTYRDYIWKDGADWKVHKATTKETLSSTDQWIVRTDAGDIDGWTIFRQYGSAANRFGSTTLGYSNYFRINIEYLKGVIRLIQSANYGISPVAPNDLLGILPTDTNDEKKEKFKSWLANNAVDIYYVPATATDTTITDAALIAQLEALAGSTTYAPQTNYATAGTGTNLPVILTVDVFKNNYAGLLARLEKAGA